MGCYQLTPSLNFGVPNSGSPSHGFTFPEAGAVAGPFRCHWVVRSQLGRDLCVGGPLVGLGSSEKPGWTAAGVPSYWSWPDRRRAPEQSRELSQELGPSR